MMFHVRTFLNDGPGRFLAYQPGDRLHPGPTVTVHAPDEEDALNAVWEVGNREVRAGVVSWAGIADQWPSFVRSLSVGDVLVIGETAWTVAPVGWTVIDGSALEWSTGPDAVESDRGSFGAPYRSVAEQEADRLRRMLVG